MSRHKLLPNDATTEQIKRMYCDGVSVADISKTVFLCETAVRCRLRSVGVVLKQKSFRHISQQKIERIRALYDEGYFQNKIADIVGVSIPTVHKYITNREINYA